MTGFLRRLVGRDPDPVPEWASFFDAGQYRRFLDVVAADLTRRGSSFAMGDGLVRVEGGDGAPQELGLANLAAYCHAAPEADWPRVVATHFSSMRSILGRDLDALSADFEQVRSIIRIRLMPDETMGGIEAGDEWVTRSPAPGIQAMLVYDFPDSTASVHPDHLARWPVDVDAVWALAVENVRAEPPPAIDTVPADGAVIRSMFGDSFYVATRALFLDAQLGDVADAVFAVPNRHVLLWVPATDLSVISGMTTIGDMADQLFREGPGSISDQLYWWHGGEIIHLPLRRERRGKVSFSPPDRFVEHLNGLDEPAAG